MSVARLGRGNRGICNALGQDESVVRSARGILEPAVTVSALTSTLTASASSFVAGGPGVTLTFTARDKDGNPVEGFTPRVDGGVV